MANKSKKVKPKLEVKTVKIAKKLTPYEQGRVDERIKILRFLGKHTSPYVFYKWHGYQMAVFLSEQIIILKY
jgi:hypothetical protein